jgi:hypothetical protein
MIERGLGLYLRGELERKRDIARVQSNSGVLTA